MQNQSTSSPQQRDKTRDLTMLCLLSGTTACRYLKVALPEVHILNLVNILKYRYTKFSTLASWSSRLAAYNELAAALDFKNRIARRQGRGRHSSCS
eukprot:SAG31_NODE_3380_length_4340_cov_2.414053_2_plen_96_part_00